MNATTIAAIRAAVKFSRGAIEYIQHDQMVMLGLRKPQWVKFAGPGIGRGFFSNGILTISSERGGDTVTLSVKAFSAWLRLWNGPDFLPNTMQDGSLEISLWHDFLFYFAPEIAMEWNCSEAYVLDWANGLLHAGYQGYGQLYPDAVWVTLKARVCYGGLRLGTPWYHGLKRLFGLAVIALCVAGCEGCALFESPPDWKMTESSGLFHNDVESIQPWISTNIVEGVR